MTYCSIDKIMTNHDKTRSRQYAALWAINGILVLIDLFWLPAAGIFVPISTIAKKGVGIVLAMLLGTLLWMVSRAFRNRSESRTIFYREIAIVLWWIGAFCAFTDAALVLQYLTVSAGHPLVDTALLRFDSHFGFEWEVLYKWVGTHPTIKTILHVAYETGLIQLATIPFILAVARKSQDYSELVLNATISGLIVVLVGWLYPASSAYLHFGIHAPGTADTVSDFVLLRSGELRQIVLENAQGLVSMPSYHAALAICFAWSLRHVRRVFPAACVLNIAMILSTPTEGGHYLADVVAGIFLGVATIYVTRAFLPGDLRATAESPLPDRDLPIAAHPLSTDKRQ